MGNSDVDALNIDVIIECQEDFNRPLIAFARDPNPITKVIHSSDYFSRIEI